MQPIPSPRRQDFTIGWICALQIELQAARAVLDHEYEDIPGLEQYILGRIGRHNVVIAGPPAGVIGFNPAVAATERLMMAFPSVRHGLLVGIGGGVPSSIADVRLGDVVVSQPHNTSTGVVQYDFGKIGAGGRTSRNGYLNAPPQDLLIAVSKLRSNIDGGRKDFEQSVSSIASQPRFHRPIDRSDVLYEASYEHVGGPTCEGCSLDRIVDRPERTASQTQIHYGLIASGGNVIKHGLTRDEISQRFGGVLCIEMEAAALMNIFPCLVIRGVCDYADSHKNKAWQPFAAAVAAAYAKDLLSSVPSATEPNMSLVYIQDLSETQTVRPKQVSDEKKIGNVFAEKRRKQIKSDVVREKILNSLESDLPNSRFQSIEPPFGKTCEWLLEKTEFQDWLDDTWLTVHHGFLWIKGKAAVGKSTLMKFAYLHLTSKYRNKLVVHFFFNARGSILEKSTLGLYRSLLSQILSECPDLRNVLDALEFDAEGQVKWTTETLQKLLRQAIEQLGDRSLLGVVDALDECSHEEVHEMVEFMQYLGEIAVNINVQFRILFSSRHYPFVMIDRGIELTVERQDEHGQDIAKYVNAKLRGGESGKVRQIREKILYKASGIFLWVVLVIPILNEAWRRGQIHAMDQRLREIPDDIEALFDDILGQGDYSDETILCLQWVLYSNGGLKMEEMYFALLSGISPSSISVWDPDEIPREVMERFVLDASKGLVEETRDNDRRVQFIHESVREFFLKGGGCHRPQFGPAETFEARSEEQLKQCCLNYYQCKEIFNYARSKSPKRGKWYSRWDHLPGAPFLEYALTNVLYHSDQAQELGVPQEKFLNQFDRILWVEMMEHQGGVHRYNPAPKDEYYHGASGMFFILSQLKLKSLLKLEICRKDSLSTLKQLPLGLLLVGLCGNNSSNIQTLLTAQEEYSGEKLITSLPSDLAVTKLGTRVVMKLLRDATALHGENSALSRYEEYEDKPLLFAARYGNKTLVLLLLACRGIDLNLCDDDGNDAAILSIIYREEEVAKKVLDRYWQHAKSTDFVFDRIYEWLLVSSLLGRVNVLNYILDQYSVLDDQLKGIADFSLNTLLSLAVKYSTSLLLKALEKHKQRSDAKIKEFKTPLSNATQADLFKVIKLINHPKTEVLYRKKSIEIATTLAIQAKQLDILQLFFAHPHVNIDPSIRAYRTTVVAAAYTNTINVVRALLDRLMSGSQATDDAPESLAMRLGLEEIVHMLLVQRAILTNLKDRNYELILAAAVAQKQLNVIQKIIDSPESDINARAELGNTALSIAATFGATQAVELLLKQHDIDVNLKNHRGMSPLSLACQAHQVEVVQMLLQREDINVECTDHMSLTPLAQALKRKDTVIATMLRTAGALDPDDWAVLDAKSSA